MTSERTIYRMTHIENLDALLRRDALHAPRYCPDDGLPYRSIHDAEVQSRRAEVRVDCGPGGSVRDYVSFYFGTRTPMLLRLHTRHNVEYDGTQKEIVYLVSNIDALRTENAAIVFSDGHGLSRMTQWYTDVADLAKIDWDTVDARMWKDTLDDPDRQRRKQAECLVHRSVPWRCVREIGVIDVAIRKTVEAVLDGHPDRWRPPVTLHRNWYY